MHTTNHRGIVGLALLTVAAALIIGAMLSRGDETSSPDLTTVDRSVEPWDITLPDDAEVGLIGTLDKSVLIYAEKSGTTVSVNWRALRDGTGGILFSYDERWRDYRQGANFWESLPANVALSAAGDKVAYVNTDGLAVYNLETGETDQLIEKLTAATEDYIAPTWSAPAATGAFGFAQPTWSRDGRYISLHQALSEGSFWGVYDVAADNYSLISVASNESGLPTLGGQTPLVWSPTSTQFAKANEAGYSQIGLYVSSVGAPTSALDIALAFGTGNQEFSEVAFSPDGTMLAFTIKDAEEGDRLLAVANTDGSDYRVLARPGQFSTPFFSADGDWVYYIDRQATLYRISLDDDSLAEVAALPAGFTEWQAHPWTTEGYLVLDGLTTLADGLKKRLMVLDLEAQTVRYVSPPFTAYATFAGFNE